MKTNMNLNQRFEMLMADLEQHIENKKDLEYIKKSFSNMFLDFLNEVEQKNSNYEEKLKQMEEKQKQIEEKSAKLEESVKKIEKELYINDNYDFEIVCPYCNCEFETEFDELKTEVKCPECNNIIELDWNEEEGGCHGDCSCCHDGCEDEEEIAMSNKDQENDEQEENEDDM